MSESSSSAGVRYQSEFSGPAAERRWAESVQSAVILVMASRYTSTIPGYGRQR